MTSASLTILLANPGRDWTYSCKKGFSCSGLSAWDPSVSCLLNISLMIFSSCRHVAAPAEHISPECRRRGRSEQCLSLGRVQLVRRAAATWPPTPPLAAMLVCGVVAQRPAASAGADVPPKKRAGGGGCGVEEDLAHSPQLSVDYGLYALRSPLRNQLICASPPRDQRRKLLPFWVPSASAGVAHGPSPCVPMNSLAVPETICAALFRFMDLEL